MMVNCAAVAGCFLSYSTLLVYYILRNGATALLAIPKENHNKKPILLQKNIFFREIEIQFSLFLLQHWIVVGGTLKVLLLDFGGSFTLLIPNGNAFTGNTVQCEVEKRETTRGQPLTFMKFAFSSPPLELSAPVLQDKQMGYKVLQQNSPCVFLGRIFKVPPQQIQVQPQQIQVQPQPASLIQLLELQQQEEEARVRNQNSVSLTLPKGTIVLPARNSEASVSHELKIFFN